MNPATLRKLVIAYLMAVPVLVVADSLHFMAVQGVVISHRRVSAAGEIVRETEALSSALQQARTTVGGFEADRPGATLASYQEAVGKMKKSMQHLVSLVHDDAAEQARVEKLEPAVNKTLEVLQQAVDLHSKEGSKPEKQIEFDGQVEKQVEVIQPLLAEMKKYESDHLAGFYATAHAAVKKVEMLTPFAAILSIWMVLVAALLLYRDSSRRTFKGVERRIHTRIFDTLPFGVCLVDEHGLINLTNPAQDSLFSYPQGGLIGRHLSILYHAPREDGEARVEQAMEELNQHGQWRGEFSARTKDGKNFNCLCQAVKLDLSGKPHHVFLLASQNPPPAE